MWKVMNVSSGFLTLNGTDISIAPKQEIDLCEALGTKDIGDIRNRPDVSRWFEKNRIITTVTQGDGNLQKKADPAPEPAEPGPEDSAGQEKTPVPLSQGTLKQMSMKQLRKICRENGIQPVKSKDGMIELIVDKLGDNNEQSMGTETEAGD